MAQYTQLGVYTVQSLVARGAFGTVSSEGCVPVHYVDVAVRCFDTSVETSVESQGGGGGLFNRVSGVKTMDVKTMDVKTMDVKTMDV